MTDPVWLFKSSKGAEMSVSDATSQATRDGVEVSDAAVDAIVRAVAELEPFAGEDPRIRALCGKLGAIASPRDFSVDPDGDGGDRLVKAMTDAAEIAKSEAAPAALRERAAKASRALQLEHLARVNPRAAESWAELHGAA
jgi:hypothetical protein